MPDPAPSIVFWGTPEAAASCLRFMLDARCNVVGAVTQPDRPVGRKQVVTPSAVKLLAISHSIPVVQPERIKDETFVEQIRAWKPDICVIVAYGRIITQTMIDIPSAFLNLHFSLLPRYRGAAPVQWAVMHGATATGVTVQHLALELDTGDIIMQHSVPISEDDTAESVLDRCVNVGAPLLVRAINAVHDGTAPCAPQNNDEATYAPKINKQHGYITWQMSARQICNQVRACTPWPGATTWIEGVPCKILAARVDAEEAHELVPGTVLESKKHVKVAAQPGIVEILELQPSNRPKMSAEAFLAGHRHAVTRFQSWTGDHPE